MMKNLLGEPPPQEKKTPLFHTLHHRFVVVRRRRSSSSHTRTTSSPPLLPRTTYNPSHHHRIIHSNNQTEEKSCTSQTACTRLDSQYRVHQLLHCTATSDASASTSTFYYKYYCSNSLVSNPLWLVHNNRLIFRFFFTSVECQNCEQLSRNSRRTVCIPRLSNIGMLRSDSNILKYHCQKLTLFVPKKSATGAAAAARRHQSLHCNLRCMYT